MRKQYYIIGIKQGKRIDLDTAETLNQATKLIREYMLAYGPHWTIDVVLK